MLLVVVGLGAAPALAQERTYVAEGWQAAGARYKPKSFWASGDATLRFTRIRWSAYGRERAVATAFGGINDCEPDCADGSMTYHRARIRYDKPRHRCGKRFYTRLKITWLEGAPEGYRRSSYFISPNGIPITC